MGRKKPIRLETTITLLVCSVVALSLLVTHFLISEKIENNTRNNQAEKATSIARMVAHTPLVIEALNGQRNEKEIQAFANEIRHVTGMQFVVVMDMKGIRKSHPDPSKVGHHFQGGDEEAVLQGREHISVAEGTLGVSLRAFTPIYDGGKQVGAVAVGISLDKVQQAIAQTRSIIFIGIGFGVLAGVAGAVLLARKVKAIMFGLEPSAIAKLLEERSAMLKSTREGMIAVDQQACITMVNDEAIRLFSQAGMGDNPVGKDIEEYLPNSRLKHVLQTGTAELDQEQDLYGITLLVNRVPIRVEEKIVGAIATFRDKTEMSILAEELTGVRLYADALRAQAHEFMNKLQVILGMVQLECYDELPLYIKGITNQQQTEVGFMTRQIKDPVLAGFLLAKMSYARESGAELILSRESFVPVPEDVDVIHELVTVLGNLIDNALEAVHGCACKRIDVDLHYYEDESILTLEIQDSGHGMNAEMANRIFEKGYSTKGDNRGMGLFLVQRSMEHLSGTLEVFSEEGKGTRFVVQIPYGSKGENR